MAVSFSTPSAAAASTDTLDSVTTRGSTTTNSIQVGGVNVAGNYALPTADGTNGQFLQTDGSGSVSFASVSVTGGLTYKGSYNAATSTPSLVTALKGDFYIISVAGSLAGVSLAVGDHIVFNQNAANPVTSAMFDVIDNSEADTLDSVTTRGSTTANSIQVGGLNVAGNYNLPAVDGSNGQAITTNGSGTLSFSTVLTDVVQDTTPQLGGPLDVNGQAITSASSGDITLNPDGTGEIKLGADLIPDADATHTIGSESERFISAYTDLNGAIRFKAKNDSGGVINKGQVVYIKGISGTVPTVGLARANSAATMPAFGLALANANDQAEMQIITFGNLTDVNTTTYSLSLNDTVYVSAATAGALTNSAPAGEANLIQNIGRVIRADAAAGIIKVGGAGRSNATPNLDDGKIFKGNASNQAESVALSSIALSSLNDDLSYLAPANNLSDLDNAATARTNLGLAIGSDVQAYDQQLADVAGLTPADGSFIVGDGVNFVAESGATARASLGLTIGTDVLAATAGLNDLSDVSFTAGAGIDNYVLTYDNGTSSWGAEAISGGGDLLAANNLSDLANIATARTNLGVAIGSDVQAYDAQLADVAGLTPADGSFIVGDGANFVTESGATARASLGLVIGTDVLSDVVQDTTPQLGGDLDLNGQDLITTSNADLDLAPHGTGVVVVRGNQTGGNNQGAIKLNCEQNTHGITIKSPAHASAATYTLTLPVNDGNASDVLQTDGAGVLSWVAQSGGSGYSVTVDTTTITTTNPTNLTSPSDNEEVYIINNGATAVTVNMVAAATCGSGFRYTFKVLGTGTITLDPNSTEYIDHSGQTTYSPSQYDSVTMVTDGSNWYLV